MRILNFEDIMKIPSSSGNSNGRELLLQLFTEAVNAVDPYRNINEIMKVDSKKRTLIVDRSSYHLSGKKIWVIGAGKAVGGMAQSLEKLLDGFEIEEGLFVFQKA